MPRWGRLWVGFGVGLGFRLSVTLVGFGPFL